MKRLLLAVLMLLPLSAGAATYSWTDASGTVNFSDDLGSVPPKYRKKVLQQAAGEDVAPAAKPSSATTETKTKAVSVPVPVPAANPGPSSIPSESTVTAATRFGERTAGEWQTEFRGLRGQIKAIEQQQEALKKEGGDGKTMLTSSKIAELNARNKQLNQEYETVRLRINALVDQANKLGLPPEFGQ